MINRFQAVRFIHEVYHTLLHQKDLSPANEIVTQCLTSFIAFLDQCFGEEWADSLPDDPKLAEATANLPLLCGMAECAMEKWWCRRFLLQPGLTAGSLAGFWYYENYLHLVKSELSLFGGPIGNRLVLLGSGALPLTAILLASFVPGLSLQCIDKDQEACDLASQLIKKLGMENEIELIHALAEEHAFPPDQPAICASLLLAPQLFSAFAGRRIKTFIARDAEGLFRLCYKAAPRPPAAYREARKTAISPGRINISRLYELA